MATGVTAESVLSKISEGHLECPICFSRFREPKMLDCFHTFCLQCLQKLAQHKKVSTTRLICPLCRHETILEGTDIACLPSNFTLSALVEEVTMQEKLLGGRGTKIKCQSCDEKNPAVSRCIDCDHYICNECKRAHERMAVMKSHRIYTLRKLQTGEISYKSELKQHVPKCRQHPDQNLNIYCNACEQVICTTCSVLNHGNPKHSIVGLPDALDKCKRRVAELVTKVEMNKAELRAALNKTDRSRQKLDTMFANTTKKISQKATQKVAKIREEEQKLIHEAEKIYKERVKTFKTAHDLNSKEVLQAGSKVDEVNRLLTQASCYEILNIEKKLLHSLTELTAKRPERVPDRLSFMDFDKEGEGLLGRLTLDQPEAKAKESQSLKFCVKKWELKTEILNTGYDISFTGNVASFSNNEIVLAHRNQLIAFSLSKSKPESPPVPNLLPIKGLTEPRCIAVNKDDQLVILDKHTVKIFNKQLQFLHQFMPNKGSKDKPKCLAVDDSNLIAVGYKEEISLHKPDGSLIRTMPAPTLGYYLTIYKQRLIYTNYEKERLLCTDYCGARIFSVAIFSDKAGCRELADWYTGPTGVCCDSDGSIYVAALRSSVCDILHYSPDGKLIGRAIRGCGLPRGITLTAGGDLVVAAGDSIQVYHRETSK